MVADPIRFGTKFLLSLKRLTFQIAKIFLHFLGLAETRRRKILSTR
jgi:hypothetical protein